MRIRKLIIGGSVLLIGGMVLFFATHRGPGIAIEWGSSNPPVSEQAYYLHRIHRLLESWMQSRAGATQTAAHQGEPVTLVVDTGPKRIWIEEGLYVRDNSSSDLAPGLRWTLYHVTGDADTTYTGRLRLRLPAPSFRPKSIGDFYLVGQGEKGYLSYHFEYGSIESSYQSGIFELSGIQRGGTTNGTSSANDAVDTESLVVQEETAKDPIDKESAHVENGTLTLVKNQSQWNDAEGVLYKAIEEAWVNKGYTLSAMEMIPGPDGSAGYAQVFFKTDRQQTWFHWMARVFGMKRDATGADLLYDNVGEGLWYVRSVPASMPLPPTVHPAFTGSLPKVECLVPADEADRSHHEKEALSLGRTKVEASSALSIPPSPWKLRLSNGIEIEVVGLCAFPNRGNEWWGPDGSPLAKNPGFIIHSPGQPAYYQSLPDGTQVKHANINMLRRSNTGVALVCRIHLPPGHTSIRRKSSSSAFPFRLSKSFLTLADSSPIVNRYGLPVDTDHYRTIIFDTEQDPIEYGFGIRSGTGNVPNYGFAWVAFRHVAGRPGHTTDFQITEETGLGTD